MIHHCVRGSLGCGAKTGRYFSSSRSMNCHVRSVSTTCESESITTYFGMEPSSVETGINTSGYGSDPIRRPRASLRSLPRDGASRRYQNNPVCGGLVDLQVAVPGRPLWFH